MGLIDWIQKQFIGKEKIEISAEDIQNYVDSEKMEELCTTEFFIIVITTVLANIIAKCEFRTCIKGKEIKDDEYYMWNYEPNKNQSGVDLKKQIVSTMIEKNECLVIEAAGQLVAADTYTLLDDNVLEEKRFTNVAVGNLRFDKEFKMSEVLFFRLNRKNVKNLLGAVTKGYKAIAQEALESYKKSNERKGTLKIDSIATNKSYGDKSFQDVYADLLNSRFQKYFKAKNAVLPLYEGFEYKENENRIGNKGESKANDFIKAYNEIAYKVALAFDFPPKLLSGEVQGLGDSISMLLSTNIDPMASVIETEINRKRYGKKVLEDSYMWIDRSTILHIDLFAVAEQVDKLIASGMCSIDELRKKAMFLELGTEESRKHFITKNYQGLEKIGKGGEDDGSTDSEKDEN